MYKPGPVDWLVNAADALGRWTARWVPSAFSIAVLLTLLAAALGIFWADASPVTVVKGWGDSFFEQPLLAFAMQMALVMFTGYLLALTSPVRRALEAVASLAGSPRGAVVLVAFASMAMAYLNWGLSIVASAMLVRHVARRQPGVDYRLLVACAYFGLGATWHAGLSASAPLVVATPGHFLEAKLGIIPIDRTLFSAFNLGLVVLAVALLCGVAWALHPPPGRTVTVNPKLLEETAPSAPPERPRERSVANLLDHAPWLNVLFAVAGVIYLAKVLADGGWQKININVVNFTFLTLAVLLHRTPSALLKAAEEAASVLSGIVLQFPLYFGIYGIFKATGLTAKIGDVFVNVFSEKTFPLGVYLYSGVVNYFVPSGGSKWAIEAPYLVEAAARLGVEPEKVVLAYAWGDMATDLIQPFWALPLLAVAKLQFKDVLGFLLVAFFIYLPVVSLAFFLLG